MFNLKEERKKRKKELIKIIKETYNNQNIDGLILFGSWARDTWKKDSDIDLLVVGDSFQDSNIFQRMERISKLWEHQPNIEIICYTGNELIEQIKKSLLLWEVFEFGEILKTCKSIEMSINIFKNLKSKEILKRNETVWKLQSI